MTDSEPSVFDRARALAPSRIGTSTGANPGRWAMVVGMIVRADDGTLWVVGHHDAEPLDGALWRAFHVDPDDDILGRLQVVIETAP